LKVESANEKENKETDSLPLPQEIDRRPVIRTLA